MIRFRRVLKLSFFSVLLVGTTSLGISSCANVGYYTQCAKGQWSLMRERRPIADLLRNTETPQDLKDKLSVARDIREFATRELGLPENGSYLSYVDLKRPYVVWNVVAAPEFSLAPVQWCFPVAGCVSYRGFFSEKEAEKFAAEMEEKGNDVYLYGVAAYSTLGWFDDPVLNTFLDRSQSDLAGLIFHELAHQRLYIKNDSAFNEAFAKTVELEGVRRWLEKTGDVGKIPAYVEGKRREEQFLHLVQGVQQQLSNLYAKEIPAAEKRRAKESLFEEMRADYARLKEEWGGYRGFDRWFATGLNNARFVSVSTYHDYVPAFQALLGKHGGDLRAFYGECLEVSRMKHRERTARLTELKSTFLASTANDGEVPALLEEGKTEDPELAPAKTL